MTTATPRTPWLCQICFDMQDSTPVEVADDHICEDCFESGMKTQFQDALANQANYPVKWGGTPLDIEDYQRFFAPEFMRQYATKVKEYAVPIKLRIYCTQQIVAVPEENDAHPTEETCGTFLGSTLDHANEQKVKCSKCHADTEIIISMNDADQALLEGQIIGKDYQLCPGDNCGARIFLAEGCNEVVCELCGTTLCYICGAVPERGHWSVGSCPRFGQKDSARAIFDDVDNAEDDEDEGVEEAFPPIARMRGAHSFDLHPIVEEGIFSTAVGRLLIADRERLRTILRPTHDGQATASPNVVRMVQALRESLDMYIAHLVPAGTLHGLLDAPTGPNQTWQDSWFFTDQHNEIRRLAIEIDVEGFRPYPGLANLALTHHAAWSGRHQIEERAMELFRNESASIEQSAENRLMRADLRLLHAVHRRWHESPMGGMAMEAAHQLNLWLLTEIDVYVDHLHEQDVLLGRPPLWARREQSNSRAQIHHEFLLMSQSPAVVAAFPELSAIVASYELAWTGSYEELRQLHPRNL
ncbi:unnamed protein product [Zymoseptoria tritici ST99CH_1A5]|uniref:IBR domain-containing protein n=3 Tax=Zymoseptoria tritici TaxID=1047171 RepID=A0A1X7RTE1_ZYMT9|nr:unnamed protein product [Zymoseptoria tritici ST99CH_3D7]SMR52550.1 unnamed protein product [Zymoseptoria tritici ST99CH_1E4]SMR53748.1 unnamed protein product [Zymoseptoria tritici ST99CH_3D1]SMY24342.1 unnamed protein product [Zymoseptoria tritici ST99CH_1A5]